jgi:putative transposase
MVTPAAHREAAAYLQTTYEMSQRRACRVISTDRTSVRYQATRPDDGHLRERLKALAGEERQQLISPQLLAEDHFARRIRAMRLEDRLRQIEPNCANFTHGRLLCSGV